MKTARTFNGLSTQIFLWFWFMLLLVLAAVVILPTLDPRNTIPLPEHEMARMNNNLRALQAGADLLLMPNGLADAYTAVLEAVQDGTIPQQRLDESVQRILQCKYQYGILTQ